jgi:hypothetical protein
MNNRTFVIVLVVVGLIVAAAIALHTPGGVSVMRALAGH